MFYIANGKDKKLTELPYNRINEFSTVTDAVKFIKKVYINNDDFTSSIIKIMEVKNEI